MEKVTGRIKELLPGGKFCIFISNGGIEMKTTLDWANKHLSKEAKVLELLREITKKQKDLE